MDIKAVEGARHYTPSNRSQHATLSGFTTSYVVSKPLYIQNIKTGVH